MGRDALRLHREAPWSRGDRGRDHRLLQKEARPLQMPEPGGVHRAAQDLHRQDSEVHAARYGEIGVKLVASLGVVSFNTELGSRFLQHMERLLPAPMAQCRLELAGSLCETWPAAA